MLGASSGSRLCCSSGPRRRRRWSSPDHAAALFAAGISGPPGDDVEVDLSTPKTGSKAKYSELTARRIKEVQERVDEGKIKLDPANWKWRHSEHEHGYRPEPADYQERAIGVWDPPTIFPGREFRCSRCTGGTMRARGWYKGARPVFAVDGTYWWLITRNMVCNKFGSQTRATTDDFLSGMHPFDRAAFKVYLGYQSSVDSELAEFLWGLFGLLSLNDMAAELEMRAKDRY